jgi:hypothetical protein
MPLPRRQAAEIIVEKASLSGFCGKANLSREIRVEENRRKKQVQRNARKDSQQRKRRNVNKKVRKTSEKTLALFPITPSDRETSSAIIRNAPLVVVVVVVLVSRDICTAAKESFNHQSQ